MTTARAFRDTIPMGLLSAQAMRVQDDLPEPDDVPVLDDAEPMMGLAPRRASTAHMGSLLMPDLAQALMGITAACAGGISLLLLLGAGRSMASGVLSVPWALLAVAAAAIVRVPLRHQWRAVTSTMVFTVLLIAFSASALELGLRSPTLSLLGLLVCATCAMAGWHAGLAVGGVSLGGLLSVAWIGWPAAVPLWGMSPALVQFATHLIVLGVGLACGAMLSRTVARSLLASQEREQRFSRLLALAADAYWEIDHHYRLSSVTAQNGQPSGAARGLGAIPWEQPEFACDSDTLDDLLAALDSRQPFRERAISWTGRSGRARHYLVSGEPRFDNRGFFLGFWGVSRDVTDMHSTQAALLATESLYQELFARTPTPLVLHRHHRVLDANPAAVGLFGYPDLRSMVGADLLEAFDGADARERARRRLDELLQRPIGAALPVADFSLRIGGRHVAVRATGVRVEAHGEPALLSIFVDDTERLSTEGAVRRSEAMLSHLVATSPDLIMVVDAASGRFTMVNQAFERVSGHDSSQAAGHSPSDLHLWVDQARYTQLMGQVMSSGSISDQPITLRKADKQLIPLRLSAARFAMDRRDYVVINARDMSDSELARVERETILTHASIGIAVMRENRFVLVNPHFERIFGWSPGSMTGQEAQVMWPGADDHANIDRRHGQALALGEPVSFEAPARRLDGSQFTAHVRARAIDPEQSVQGGTLWIVEDVTDRRQFEQALARARDDAESASRAKSAFLANTSHELRTPLNGLMGLARLARDPETSELRRKQYLDQLVESAQTLTGMITDILDVSKIEAGKLLMESAVFDLGKLLLSLKTTYTPLAQANRLVLYFDIDPAAMGSVVGDATRVRQVLSNYISNALKFTAQGQLRVRVHRLPAADNSQRPGPRVRMEVHDTGSGISAEVQAQLFKPFSQADQSSTRRHGGAGLGLSINRDLATLMGGEVGVISAPGQGSTFWVELPLPDAPTPAAPEIRPEKNSLQGLRVLLVEDNPVNMLIAVAMLERWGVHASQASNGRDALLAVNRAAQEAKPFDAVLMDVQMPVMSGHDATRELRKSAAGRDLPIIALTAAALVSEREEAMRAGMNAFLTKPIDSEKLRNTLLRYCTVAH